MKRREFLVNSGFILGTGLLLGTGCESKAQTLEQSMENLVKADLEKNCQKSDDQQSALALAEVKPVEMSGILAHSVGCRSPHKHLLFVDARFLLQPDLVEVESDVDIDGVKAKKFYTSTSYDMSWIVKHVVGAHRHEVILTKLDMIQIQEQDLKKIAFQMKWPSKSEIEPGHLFTLSMKNLI